MKASIIDLEEFFKDKYRYQDNNLGFAATGVITNGQMVTRINDYPTHFMTEAEILHDIFDFDMNLFLSYGYNYPLYNQLEQKEKNTLTENVVIKYINNSTGNLILIYLPEKQGMITINHLKAIKYLDSFISDASWKISRPIKIIVTDRKKKAVEMNSLKNSIIPFCEERLTDSFEPVIPDKHIIATEDIEEKTLKLVTKENNI